MLRSSSGFHTIKLFKNLLECDADLLFEDFKRYRKDTGNIVIMPIDELKKTYIIYYPNDDRGIIWFLKFCTEWQGFNSYTISAIINPKILGGVIDYVRAANQDYLKITEIEFNIEAQRISKILGNFSSFRLNRIDYCVNFDLDELGINCSPEQIIDLIKRSNIPAHFEERKVYDKDSHRMKSDESSFYLISNSVVINCYYKYVQLMREFPDCPNVAEARNVIRFEVQCKYNKVYNMLRAMKKNNTSPNGCLIYDMLSDEFCKKIINNYFDRTIMHGDYYTLQEATNRVKSRYFRSTKEKRMIWALTLINESRGIPKAKEKLNPTELLAFHSALDELSFIGINPVTIPKSWNISNIPNLLDTFNKTF